MVIEFIGIPGSGKTTLKRAAIDHLRLRGVDAMDLDSAMQRTLRRGMEDGLWSPLMRTLPAGVGRRIGDKLFERSQDRYLALKRFMLSNPTLFEVVMRSFARRSQTALRPDLALGWFIQMVTSYEFVTSRLPPEAVLVLDEGFSQRVVVLFGHRFGDDDPEDLAGYAAAMPKPDLLFHIETPPEAAASRLQRWSVRLAGFDTQARHEFLADADACIAAALREFDLHGVNTRHIPNKSRNIEPARRDLLQQLDNWLGV